MFGFPRHRFVLLGLGAAALGVPVAMSTGLGDKVSQAWSSMKGDLGEESAQSENNTPDADADVPFGTDTTVPPLRPVEGPPVDHLAEVLSFQVTKARIVQRWPRVFTGLQRPDPRHEGYVLQGFRVALVTGTEPDDLAGALTYYFNHQQQVQSIAFEGTTGDARRLVDYVARHHGFRRRDFPDPARHVYESRGLGLRPGVLEIRELLQQRDSAPHRRYEVSLLMQR